MFSVRYSYLLEALKSAKLTDF
jgi:hypothetical protein